MAAVSEQVIWVVGGGTGMGRGIVLELAAGGATVIVSGRRMEPLQEVVKTAGPKARVFAAQLDVADSEAVARTAESILKQHGRVDTLVMAAGIDVAEHEWSNVSIENWEKIHAVNAHGPFYCIRSLLPSMRERRQGLIINISSWGGRFALRLSGPAYAASKRGLIAMTETLNIAESENGIRACVICPAGIKTDIIKDMGLTQEQLDVLMEPEDFGRLVRFIAETPARITFNEILISPTVNLVYQMSA